MMRSVAAWRPAFNLNRWLNFQGAAAQQDVSLNGAANAAFAATQSNYTQNMANLAAVPRSNVSRLRARRAPRSFRL